MRQLRQPAPSSSALITPEGWQRLEAELQFLWKVKRPEVTRAVQEAAAQGDRSENAEYIYGKKQLREIDRRVRFLSKRLEVLKVIDRLPSDTGRIYFGACVELEDETGETACFRLVGPDETDAAHGHISIDAPLSRALLGKRVDDEVVVDAPAGARAWLITSIRYKGTPT